MAFVRGVMACFDAGGIDVVRLRVDIDVDRSCPEQDDGLGGGDEGERRGDHLVAGPDAEGHEGDLERVGARGTSDGVADAEVAGDGALELPHILAEDELAGVEDRRAMAASTSGLIFLYWPTTSTIWRFIGVTCSKVDDQCPRPRTMWDTVLRMILKSIRRDMFSM